MEPPAEHIQQEIPVNNCDTCNESFQTAYALEVHHLFTHSNSIPCEKCDTLTFTSLELLDDHIKQMHKRYFYSCKQCRARKFTTRSELLEHANNHDRYPCNQCDKKFASSKSVVVHIRKHAINNLTCKECKRKCADLLDLRKHELTHLKNLPACPYCSKKYPTANALRKHLEVKHKILYNTCTICQEQFETHKKLTNHSHTHNEIYFKCNISHCSNTNFATQNGFELHRWRIHPYLGQFIRCQGDGKASKAPISRPQIHEELQSSQDPPLHHESPDTFVIPNQGDGLASTTSSSKPQIHEELQSSQDPPLHHESPDTFAIPNLDIDQSQSSEIPDEVWLALQYLYDIFKTDDPASYGPQIHEELQSSQGPSSYNNSIYTFETPILDEVQILLSDISRVSQIVDEMSAILFALNNYKTCTCFACQGPLTADDLDMHTDHTFTEEHFTTIEKRNGCLYCPYSFTSEYEAARHQKDKQCIMYFVLFECTSLISGFD